MNPTPAGAVLELVVGVAFLVAAWVEARGHRGHPDVHAGLAVAVHAGVGTAALGAASAAVDDVSPTLAWVSAAVVLVGALIVMLRRVSPRRLVR